jgi:predicted transcriptional regulator
MEKVNDILERQMVLANPNTTVEAASKLLERSSLPFLPVIEEGKLVGVFSGQQRGKEGKNGKVAGVMKRPFFIEKGKSVNYAVKYMLARNLTRIPVVDSAIAMHYLGVISSSGLIRAKRQKKEKTKR